MNVDSITVEGKKKCLNSPEKIKNGYKPNRREES